MIYMSILQLFLLGALSTPYKFLHMTSYNTHWKLNKYIPKNIQVIPLNYIRDDNKVLSGNDETYNNTDDTKKQFNVCLNIEKQRILSILMNHDVSLIQKMEIFVTNKYLFDDLSLTNNIKSGGLYDDYNFEEF